LEKANSFKTDFEKIQFFENIKMEHDIAVAFCKAHISLIKKCKKYLLDFEFDESQVNSDESINYEFVIKSHFTLSDSWNQFFCNEQDYTSFVENWVSFFSGTPCNEKLKIKIKTKTYAQLSKILHDIYYDCSKNGCLKKDKKFLSLVKNLTLYSDLTLPNIYLKLIHT
jgi:hypothetical protein